MLCALIEAGCVRAYPVDPTARHPNTSFPAIWAGGRVERSDYVVVTPTVAPIPDHTQTVTEGVPEQIDGAWVQTWIVTHATPGEIAARTEGKAAELRQERNQLLATCDWTQLPDAPLSPGQRITWAAYRQALRDLPSGPGWPWQVGWPPPPA